MQAGKISITCFTMLVYLMIDLVNTDHDDHENC